MASPLKQPSRWGFFLVGMIGIACGTIALVSLLVKGPDVLTILSGAAWMCWVGWAVSVAVRFRTDGDDLR